MKNGIERRLFVAATSQNDGKTTCSLGFVRGFCEIGWSVGFIKPVGQRYVEAKGCVIDEDSLLVHEACGLGCPLKDLNPVVVKRDLTRQFLDNPKRMFPGMQRAISNSFAVAAKDNDLVVIEGTGHAGVGSVFGLSNAHVAKMLNAKVVIVTVGGIGRPVDEVAVNRSLFEKEEVPVIGVVVNKVLPEKLDQTKYYLTKAFAASGLELLGVIPYAPRLAWPTVQQVAETMGAEVLNGHGHLTNPIADIIIGAMTTPNALKYLRSQVLLIVPGDRDDVVLGALTLSLLKKDVELAGLLFTGGIKPQPQTMDLVSRTDIPVLAVDVDTYDAASQINDILVKIRVTEEDKIRLAAKLVRDHVDFEKLWELLA